MFRTETLRQNLGALEPQTQAESSVFIQSPSRINLGQLIAVSVPFGGLIEIIANKTYPLFTPSRAYTIRSLQVKSVSGTCTWAVQINGVNVTGLSAVAVSSVAQTVNATANNLVAANQRVIIVSTANSTASDVEFTLMLEVV